MPAFEIMFPHLVTKVQDEEVREQLRNALGTNEEPSMVPLTDVLDQFELIDNQGQREFIAKTPRALQVAILAVVRDNLRRETPKQMMFTWEPSYDWELVLHETTSSSVSAGGITVRIGSRYPDDPHPGQAPLT